MKSPAAFVRAVLFVAVAIGMLVFAAPVAASASGHVATAGQAAGAKPSPGTAPRGGTAPPSTGGSLSDTGPKWPIVELTLLAGGLLIAGVAINCAARKPRRARP